MITGAVVVFDARRATVEKAVHGQVAAGTGIRTAVLRDGMTYDVR
jgi:hypothetical protein